jgi:hypothetical protein
LRRIAGSHTTRCVRGDVREEIDRYCDPDLDDNVERAFEEFKEAALAHGDSATLEGAKREAEAACASCRRE